MDQRTAFDPLRPRSGWTPFKQRIFLAALAELGCVTRAAHAAGMSRSSAQRLRNRLTGTIFDHAWDSALAHYGRQMANPLAQAAAAQAPRR